MKVAVKLNPLKKLQEPLKKFENLFTLILKKLEKIPGEVLNLGEKCFKGDKIPFSGFVSHFHDFAIKGVNDLIEKSIVLVLNELADLVLGFEVNCFNILGCCISCFLEGFEAELKREFLKLLDELKSIGLAAEEEMKGFTKHVVEAVHEMKELGTHRIKEFVEAFKLSITSFPKFIEDQKDNILEVLKQLPKVKGPNSFLELIEKCGKIIETIILQLKNLVEPVKAIANLLADFIKVIIKLISEEVQEACGKFVEALRKINTFLQGAGDRVAIMMNPPGWTTIFLKVNREQLWRIRQSFMTLQNAVDLEKVCVWIEATMEFLTGKESVIDKSSLIVEELKKGALIVGSVIDDFEKVNGSVESIKEIVRLIKEKELIDLAENVGKKTIDMNVAAGEKSIDAAFFVGEKSLFVSGGVVHVSGKMGKKSIELAGGVGKKALDLNVAVGKKSVQFAEDMTGGVIKAAGDSMVFADKVLKKSVHSVGNVGKKSLIIAGSVGKNSVNSAKFVGKKSVQSAETVADTLGVGKGFGVMKGLLGKKKKKEVIEEEIDNEEEEHEKGEDSKLIVDP